MDKKFQKLDLYGFTEDWEQRKFKEFAIESRSKMDILEQIQKNIDSKH